jgi:hypothetical protein
MYWNQVKDTNHPKRREETKEEERENGYYKGTARVRSIEEKKWKNKKIK